MIPYLRNNIVFRIASSDAISKFKSIQAHTFLQLARHDIKFDDAAREVVLLEYDRFSQWLYRLERMFLAVGEGEVSVQLRHAVIESLKEEISVIESVLDAHSEVFSPYVIDFTKIVHGYSHSIMHSIMMEGLAGSKADRAYAMIAHMVSEYLQHLLTSLHEYNNNLVTKLSPPFVCVGTWCTDYASHTVGFTPIIKRAEFFKKLKVSNSFMLKNYTEKPELHDDVFRALAPFGVLVTREEAVAA